MGSAAGAHDELTFTPPRWGTARNPERDTALPIYEKVAEALGFELFAWQRHQADVALELIEPGQFAYRTVGVAVGRQNGKTVCAVTRIAMELLHPGHRVVYTAQDRNLAHEKWEEHVDLIMDSSLAARVDKVRRSNGSEQVTMRNGATYGIVAPNRKAARGKSLDLVIIDEALTHTHELIGAIGPTMATKKNAQLWLLSNAGDATSTLLRWYRDLAHRQLEGDSPTTQRVCWHEWAPWSDEFDADDPEVWRQAIPSLGEEHGVSLEAVAEYAATMEPATFVREMLNVWPAMDAVRAISVDEWDRLARPDVAVGESVTLALAVSPDRDWSSIVACGPVPPYGHAVELVEHKPGTAWVEQYLVELWQRWRAPVVIDQGGPAGAMVAVLERAGVEVRPASMREYAYACQLFYDRVMDQAVSHQGDQYLRAAVDGASRRKVGEGWAWSRSGDRPITPLEAASLALWGSAVTRTRGAPQVL